MKHINTKRLSNNRMISGAIYDFLGYLTTLSPPIVVGSSEDCTIPLDKFMEWAQERGLDIRNADVFDWTAKI
jgi:hypothetical protein